MSQKKKREIKFEPTKRFEETYKKYLENNPGIKDKLKTFTDYKSHIPPKPLPRGMSDHALEGKLFGIRECHLAGNILLLYTHSNDVVTLLLLCDHDDLDSISISIK